jgi:MFS family permease
MPIGSGYAAIQLIFPNQVRGQVSAFFMFILNLGGISLGPLMPGVFNDYLFKNERMLGPSVSLTIVLASSIVAVVLPLTYGRYRQNYQAMNPAAAESAPE